MMNKKEIIACLKENRKITDYEITMVHKDSRELFYVLDHLELNRAVKVDECSIEVYVSDGKKTGSSTVKVTAADDPKSLGSKLSAAVRKARQAANRYYPLAAKTSNIREEKPRQKDLNDIAMKVAKAVLAANVYRQGWINSTEIFVSQFTREFISSNGIKHKAYDFKVQIECIPTWSNGKEEFELYKFYESNRSDYHEITREVDEILKLAKDRSRAVTLKEVNIPKDVRVLVKGEMADYIIYNLSSDLSYRNVYMKQNHYDKKDRVSDNPFTLTLKPVIAGCSASCRFDGHGVVLKPRKLIDKGTVKNYCGDIRYGYYLGEEEISGDMKVAELKAEGTDYAKKPHLIIESFSSPQLENNSGYWGGEVRLARYFDGRKYIPLTGFSIAGNIYEDLKNVEFSKEQTTDQYYKGPAYFIFRNIEIS